MPTLQYGEHAQVELHTAEESPTVVLGMPHAQPIDDLPAAIACAINDPIDFPALRRATTPGDRVVLAIAPGLPWAAEAVAAIVDHLIEAGVQPDGISVLTSEETPADASGDPRRLLGPRLRGQIEQHIHNPKDPAKLAYLATTESGHPIRINHILQEADLIVPIGCLLGAGAAGYFGIHTGLYPAYADAETQSRFRSLSSLADSGQYKQNLIDEVNEVAWLLGIAFTLQLLPADGFGVLEVLAGHADAVRLQAQQRYTAIWQQPLPTDRSGLVVAGIGGKASVQTWSNLGRALENARRLVEDGGAVAVCCDLGDPPGPGVQRMVRTESRRAALSKIRKERPIDAIPAAQIASALDQGTVYLLSKLDPEIIEDLDMVPITSPAELVRLVSRHKSCTLLANAPFAVLDS